MRSRIAVHLLFFASGVSGLLWQVAWVRGFARVFGHTVVSAAVVAGVFVAGLGVGAMLAGRHADRAGARPLRAFGFAELLIGTLGLLGALVLPAVGPWSAALAGYVPGPSGWLLPAPLSPVVQGLVALLLVGVPATLMGATLSLLIRHQVGDDVQRAGARVGMLYGINTLGAAAGALAADAVLIPTVGMLATQLIAAALNASVGVVALCLTERPVGETAREQREQREPLDPRVTAALFLGGFAALGLEILWLRFIGSALGAYRAVFSTLLAVHLVGLWLGATAGGALAHDRRRARTLLACSQAAVAVLALWPLFDWDPRVLVEGQLSLRAVLAGGGTQATLALMGMHLGLVAALVLPASIAMGAAFPLANAIAQRAGEVGTRTGQLYLATASGNVLGSLAVGLWLVPALGVQRSAVLLACIAIAGAAVLAMRFEQWLAPIAAAVAVTALTATAPADQLLWAAFPAGRVDRASALAAHEGVEHTIVVTGSAQGPARLWTSGHPMTATTAHAQRYMRLMAHLPLLQMEQPRDALVVCFGVGNTVHAASLHPLARIDVADLDRDVLAHANHFRHANRDVLSDGRVRVIVDDGRHWLAQQAAGRYDLVTLEPPPIATAGVGSLYSVEFYEAARRALRPGGAISQWLPAYQVGQDEVRSLVAAFVQVFPEATLHVGDQRELILVGWNGERPSFDLAAVGARFTRRPGAAADLAAHGVDRPAALALTFAADGRTLAQLAQGVAPLTDDLPALEYAKASHITETRLPPGLMAARGLGGFCPACAHDAQLMDAIAVADRIYRSDGYTHFSNLVQPHTVAAIHADLDPAAQRTVQQSETLQWLLGRERRSP